jgi:hypothetical protein
LRKFVHGLGVCASKNFNYKAFAGGQPAGWILGSNGNCCNDSIGNFNYCPSFHKGVWFISPTIISPTGCCMGYVIFMFFLLF